MIDSLPKRQLVLLLILAGALASGVFGQVNPPYFITTIAGGGPPNGVASTGIGLSFVYGTAVDSTGNIYFAAQLQHRIYKAAPNGTITTLAGNGTAGFSGDNGPAPAAQLSNPIGVAVDTAGNVYIADTGNYRIRKVLANGIITTVAGTGNFGFSGDGGPAANAQLSAPNGVALDSQGNLYIADTGNARIRVVQGGVINTIAGTGSFGFSGDNGLATSAQISFVNGLAVDTNGNVFFGDTGSYRVRKVAGGIITTVAGTGINGFSGDGGPALSAQIGSVNTVAVDGAGNLYIADSSNGRVRKISGGTINTLTGGGQGCGQQINVLGDNCPPGNASLSSPWGLAFDGAGNLYIADTFNYRVRKVAGGIISTVAGNGSFQYSGDNGLAATAQLTAQGVAARSPGNYYIADNPDFRVRNVAGGVIMTAAGNGLCCSAGDNIPATSASLAATTGVAVDSTGNLYTAEGARVREVSGGIINTIAGNGSTGFSGDGGLATNAQLGAAVAVAVDGSGSVYVADQTNNRVRKIAGGLITTVAGGGPSEGVSATGVSLGQTVGVAADAAGNLYIPSASDHRVYRISTGGIITTVAGSGSPGLSGDNGPATAAQLNYPYGVAVNSAGTVVYIADRNNNRVRRVSGGTITTVAGGGGGCAQQTNNVGDNCPGTSAILNLPGKLALDPAGNVYIADALDYRVRKLSGGVITTVAGTGFCCTPGGLGDGGPATAAEVNYAAGLAIDPTNGDLYIGDSENFRVRKVSAGVITTVAGTGSYGYGGDGGAAISAQLSYSYGVAVDSTGNLYIADAANNRIRKVAGGVINTVAGTGTGAYNGDNQPATGAHISNPYDVAVDAAGNLYIADTSNYRVRKVAVGNITTVGGNGLLSFSGDGGPATGAQLNGPAKLAVDGAGNLYIADNGNSRVRRVSPGGVITTVAGDGTYSFVGENVPAASPIGTVQALAVDNSGNLYMADPFNRIRKLAGGFINTVAGTGASGFSGDGGPALAANLYNPQGLSLDNVGNIYIADSGNSRIRLLTTSIRALGSLSPSSVVGGTSAFTLTVSGSGFAAGDAVYWNGTPLITTFVNGGQLTASVGAGLIAQPGSASVTVNGLSNALPFTILCSYSLNPASSSTGSSTGTGTFSVQTGAGCGWTAVSNTAWLTVTLGATGTGNGTVGYSFSTNPNGTPRSATVTAGGQTFTLIQAGGAGAGSGLRFVPVTPCRVADTRGPTGAFGGPNLAGGLARDFDIVGSACGVPAKALAYALNLTVVPIGGLGFLTVWPAGQPQPGVSTLNSLDGRIKANAAIVPAGLNGAITLYASSSTHAIIDINGYFIAPDASPSLAFYPIAPCRLADTRGPAGNFGAPALAASVSRNFPVLSGGCGIPANAQAYATNMTVVPSGPLGFLTAWAAGSPQPGSSTLNALTGAITSNMAIVPAGTAGAIAVFATNSTELIIDINGYFAPPGAPGSLDFYTSTPCRAADTRNSTGPFGGPIMGATATRAFAVQSSGCGIPANAAAYSLNATVVPPAALGFLQLWGSGAQPAVSTLNSLDGTIVANAALVPAGAAGVVTAYTSDATHLILDINGYFK